MNSDIQRNNLQPRLSASVVHDGLVYISGQVPSTLTADIRQQTLEVLGKVETILNEANSNKSRILTAQIWLKHIDLDFSIFNELWEDWLPKNSAPARVAFQADLARPQVLVEVMVTAATK